MWWKLLAGAVVIALAGLLVWRFGEAKFEAGTLDERAKWLKTSLDHQKEIGKLEVSLVEGKAAAIGEYADRLAALEPIVVHSKETVTRYAQTAEGRVLCLAPDRVRGIESTRSTIFSGYSVAPVGGTAAVPPDTVADRPNGELE